MYSAKELEVIEHEAGTMAMPEVFYGYNRLFVSKKDKDLLLEFAPLQALSLAAFKKRKVFLKGSEQPLEEQLQALSLDQEDLSLNQVDMVPDRIEVKDASYWKTKDTSQVKDFKQIDITSDWTYSTTYKGNVGYLSKQGERVKAETSLNLAPPEEKGNIRIEPTEEAIPLQRLGRENPIIHFGEVFLYEDDLGDQGYTMCQSRFRVMKDCFYILQRYFLRVDEVLVRMIDTRIFHSFDSDYVLREFQYKESTYDQLKAKDFKLNSESILSKTFSDEVFSQLELKAKFIDKIFF